MSVMSLEILRKIEQDRTRFSLSLDNRLTVRTDEPHADHAATARWESAAAAMRSIAWARSASAV